MKWAKTNGNSRSPLQGKIYVGKFSDITITDDQIKEHFMQYGNVVELQRPVDRSKNEAKNFCFVTYDKGSARIQISPPGC